ncbi:MAG: 5'-methylthioadenosine phosphorylase [Solirubrobacterales bacterium]|nr:5'-methylthioadenosine phosphorylase [Solirubrobacterales bacterium]
MAGRLAVIVGSALRGAELPRGDWALLQRHGEAAASVLPHRIDHIANLRALADAGCDRALAIGSVGGLRPELGPGTLVCPDDFVALDAPPLTALEGAAAHRVPGFERDWRATVVRAFAGSEPELVDGGVYWQASGPRLETPAEIRFVAAHADVIGMTLASEAVVAGELDLRYAAVCMVDNYANGVIHTELTLAEIETARERNRAVLDGALERALPELA